MSPRSALLVIDVQNDFCAGGALAVPAGDQVVPPLNRMIAHAGSLGLPVYATRDWHPRKTRHFAESGGRWPVHCVAGSPGARFHPGLALPETVVIVSKGDRADAEGYSAFGGHTAEGTALAGDLRARGIEHLYVGGLATDYCVKHSVVEALRAGFKVTLMTDAVRGVDAQPGDAARALTEMKAAGAEFQTTEELLDDGPA